MPVKEAVNRVLSRVTGYHLTKGQPGADAQNRGSRPAARPVRPQQPPATPAPAPEAKPVAPPEAKPAGGPKFPRDYDPEIRDTIRAVRPYTMTELDKLHALIMSTRYIARHRVPGAFVECGVWRGGSMHAAARTLTSLGDQSRDLYLFDTFEGMPPPSEIDVRVDGQSAAHLLATRDKTTNVWAVATLDDVKRGFESVPYPKDRVHYVQGKVEDTIPGELPDQIALLRLDTDWYESTAHELATAYDRLVPGGVLMIDDYGHWAGSRQATDEFLERTGEPLLLLRMASGRVGVKPWR